MDISKGRYWDKPWSLVSSCTRCSPGCEHCWSLAMEKRFHKGIEGVIQTHPERLGIPLKRRKPIVYAVWNDLHHENVGRDMLQRAYATMTYSPQHTFLVLTKRPHTMATHVPFYAGSDSSNIYHGLTVCNQQEADEKIPVFLQVPGKKFLSIEPCLSEINFGVNLFKMGNLGTDDNGYHRMATDNIDAVILGGETGPGARPMHPDWVRSVRDQCTAAGVPFFLKHINKKDGRILDGRTHDDLPWRTS